MAALLLGAAAFALYTATLAPTVLAGDGGEFQFVPYLLGVAHPTGYPLYCLLGWAWSHLLPVGDVAYRMNLFSAFWAAMAVGLLYSTSRALLRQAFSNLPPLISRLLAALATATFAVTPTLWSQAVIAEVYALHTFFVVLIFFLLLSWGERQTTNSSGPVEEMRGRGFLLAATCCFGFSLTHHSTTVLLVPAILAYIWLTNRRARRGWRRDWRRVWMPALLLALLPLVLYLYIPLRAPHTPYLSWPLSGGRELVLYENTLTGFLEFVTGGPFGGSVDFSVDLGGRLAMAWGFLRDELGWVGLVLALVGLVQLVCSRPSGDSGRGRWALLALTGLAYLAAVAFNLVYTIGDIFVLFIPSYVVVVLWLAVGVGDLVQFLARVQAQFANRSRLQVPADSPPAGLPPAGLPVTLVGALVALLFFAMPIWMASTRYPSIDQSQNTRARERWEAILSEPIPPQAILVSNDRNNIMPMWYFQFVDGEPGLPIPGLMGVYPLITPDYAGLGQVLDLALSTDRPVYLIKEMQGIEIKVETVAEGQLWRVIGPAVEAEPAYPLDLSLADAVALTGYDRSPRSPRPGETFQVSLYWEALQPLDAEYHTFVHLLDPAGQKVAQSDRQPGGIYYPTTLWQPGERLRDDHLLTVPASATAGVYSLLAGMYALADDGALRPLGEAVIVGQMGVKTGVRTEPAAISHPVGASFAGLIELLGYDTAPGQGQLTITLHWRCVQPPNADYTVFVHLLDAGSNVVAQSDAQPQSASQASGSGQPLLTVYPTSVWDAGEIVTDPHLLALPADLPAGDYRLRLGLYLLETGERLPVEGAGDSVELGQVDLGE